MSYIVIEKFDYQYPCIVTNEEGMPLIFDEEVKAQIAADECQDGLVVEL